MNTFPNNPLLWEKQTNKYTSITYSETLDQVKKLALGLTSIGISEGDKVALLSEGRNLWLISELAVLCNRAITVPLSIKLEAKNELEFRLIHSESKFIIVSKNQLQKIREIKHNLPALKKIIILDPCDRYEKNELYIEELLNKGKISLNETPLAFDAMADKVLPDDIATITYTSGTTSQPKGIMLTHRNYTANVEQAFSYINIPSYYKTLAFLPWDHAFAHTASLYAFMLKGASIASVQTGKTTLETLKNISINIKEVKPHVLMSVPALAKNLKKSIEKNIEQQGAFINALFKVALKTSMWYNGIGFNRGMGIKKLTFPLVLLFKKMIFKKIKEGFGGNLKYFIGGGALLDIDLQQFFYAIDIPMYQGYGLSEASPIISANTPKFHKLGSSGKVVNNLEIKICDSNGYPLKPLQQGEIVIKGENVMKGYWKNEEATKETIKNNWLYTGDLGYLDKDDFLYVKGRFKSLLIGSDGEKYSPEEIEEAILDHCQSIDQIMLYNNQNAYTIAIIVPNINKAKSLITEDSELEMQKIISQIDKEIKEFKIGGKFENHFPQRWLPSTFAIAFEPFSEQNKLINSTMKMVRDNVTQLFRKEIDICYSSEGKNIANTNNLTNLKKLIQ
ncbi:AMP-dependent synthetase/ligase [Plebeiibacterium sediminum]|uniref:AMP-binding protein n=1 Tax=Plebeiibacterium sediminum TaxID=2992112 RepID=A0AAE3M5S5_9BACT|nr:AMP-binding protein [Plebeiobacterium sediminum]MCW3787781.1 AMP-binding protein [Plebeiobacterium sediminum]